MVKTTSKIMIMTVILGLFIAGCSHALISNVYGRKKDGLTYERIEEVVPVSKKSVTITRTGDKIIITKNAK